MTLSHTTELVWVWRKGYLWSWHCDRSEREGEANSSKHPSRPISSEELHRQETQSIGIQSRQSRIPSSLPNERCTPLRYQRKASSPLHWSVSYPWQVWANVLSSGTTSEAISGSCLPTQEMPEASNKCDYRRHHPIGTWAVVQGIPHQDSWPIRLSHPPQDYSVLQDPMEWALQRWSHVGTWGLSTSQLPRVPSIKVTTPPPPSVLCNRSISGRDLF
jgi:hypothetical protein